MKSLKNFLFKKRLNTPFLVKATQIFLVATFGFFLIGCESFPKDMFSFEPNSKTVNQEEISKMLRQQADLRADLETFQSQIADLKGRLELETQRQKNSKSPEVIVKESLEDYKKVLEEHEKRLVDLESHQDQNQKQMNEVLSSLNTLKKQSLGLKKVKTPFVTAQKHFSKKQYQEALFYYQDYITRFPKGKYVANAIYKIAKSFERIKKKSEARIFYKQVIEEYPKSSFAKAARKRIRSL